MNGFPLGLKKHGLAGLGQGRAAVFGRLRLQAGVSCTEGKWLGNISRWPLSTWRVAQGRELSAALLVL